jgi:hypothetical protein
MRNAVRVAQLHMLRNLEDFRVMFDMAWQGSRKQSRRNPGKTRALLCQKH